MRWIFLDENNATETENKQRTIERIDNFWKWYSQFVAETKPSIEREDLSRFMSDFARELAKVDRELFWEMSPLVNGERRVVITPENNFFMHPLVATMIARAPELPGFRFMAYRNSVEPENIAGWVKWKAGRWIPDVQIIAEVAERNCINLTFIAKEFSGHDKRRDIA